MDFFLVHLKSICLPQVFLPSCLIRCQDIDLTTMADVGKDIKQLKVLCPASKVNYVTILENLH